MQYIVLDMEWNQPWPGTYAAKRTLPVKIRGEIIQIGAVRVTDRQIVGDEFQVLIRPKVYRKLNKKVSSLTGIKDAQLAEFGVPFPEAIEQFRNWCGDDCVFLTWGFDDIGILKENMALHGLDSSFDNMVRFLDAFGDDMEFCQIQLNYIDYTMQDAKRKVEYLKKAGIPIWVMEPLRGGKIISMTEPVMDKLKELRPGDGPVDWAFRFLQSFPEVATILTGVSDRAQTEEKLKLFENEEPLSGKEMETLLSAVGGLLSENLVPCTACRYCTSHCPAGLDIPSLIDLYNEHKFSKGGFIAPMAVAQLPEDKRPSACLGCRKCEELCPQQIKISEVMKDFVEILASYPQLC